MREKRNRVNVWWKKKTCEMERERKEKACMREKEEHSVYVREREKDLSCKGEEEDSVLDE